MSSIGRTITVALLLGFFSTGPAPIYAQSSEAHPYSAGEPDCSSPQYGFLNVETNKRGFVEFTLDLCVASANEPRLRQELPGALGCLPDKTDFSTYKKEAITALEVNCEIQLSREALQFAGQIDPSSMQSLLKDAGLEGLTVDIWLPRYGSPACSPLRTKAPGPRMVVIARISSRPPRMTSG
jgi:hypothetical protein